MRVEERFDSAFDDQRGAVCSGHVLSSDEGYEVSRREGRKDPAKELVRGLEIAGADCCAGFVGPHRLLGLDASEDAPPVGGEPGELRPPVQRIVDELDQPVCGQGVGNALDALACQSPISRDVGDRQRLLLDCSEYPPARSCLSERGGDRVARGRQHPFQLENQDDEIAQSVPGARSWFDSVLSFLYHPHDSILSNEEERQMNLKLELVTIPVSDVDRAKAFSICEVGFNLDNATCR